MILTIKLLVIMFISGWTFVLGLVIGETHALNNPTTNFTRWWRKHIIGKDIYND